MTKKKCLALLLVFALLLIMTGFMPESLAVGESGLCPNHTQHDESCGYAEAVPGADCAHLHDAACGYIEAGAGTPCSHTHDEGCAYAGETPEQACGHQHGEACAQPDENGDYPDCPHVHDGSCGYVPATGGHACAHVHDADCGYVEAAAGTPCNHQHDESCGYREAVAGALCAHTCELCALGASGAAFAITVQPENRMAGEGEEVTFTVGANGENLAYQWQRASMLEDTSAFSREDIADPAALTWEDVEGAADSEYTFTATLADLTENFYRCQVTNGEETLYSDAAAVSEPVLLGARAAIYYGDFVVNVINGNVRNLGNALGLDSGGTYEVTMANGKITTSNVIAIQDSGDASPTTVTLNGVNIESALSAFIIPDNYTNDVYINIIGNNTLKSKWECGIRKYTDTDSIASAGELRISGTGSLTAITDYAGCAAIGGGDGYNGVNISIGGGTTIAVGGIGGGNGTVTITGGSLNASMSSRPTNENGQALYQLTATLIDEKTNAPVPDLRINSLTEAGSYGLNGVTTDKDGKLYLWLPENTVLSKIGSVGAGDFTYTGVSDLMVQANDANAGDFSSSGDPPVIATAAELPKGYIGLQYDQALTATGGTPITWKLKTGSILPPGLTMNTSTGKISGKPETTGRYEFTIQAHNNDGLDERIFAIDIEQSSHESVSDPVWSGTTATWNAVATAVNYTVELYKDLTTSAGKVGEYAANSTTSYDFSTIIQKNGYGTYYFRVQAADSGIYKKGPFSKFSSGYAYTLNFTGIIAPAAITELTNGTALAGIKLPQYVTITTTDGERQAEVIWHREGAAYDPASVAEQTFTIPGTVMLPDDVMNPNGLSNEVRISITVKAKGAVGYSGGSGTITDPYLISTDADLMALDAEVRGGNDCTGLYFKVTADGLSASISIGTSLQTFSIFNGFFDGQNHTIHLDIDGIIYDYQGLFGYVGPFGVVQNVSLTGQVMGGSCIGSVAGKNEGRILNCHSSVKVSGKSGLSDKIGGITGYNKEGVVEKCTNTGDVSGLDPTLVFNPNLPGSPYVGGITGYNDNGRIKDCTNSGKVKVHTSSGGIAGYNGGTSAVVEDCINSGEIVEDSTAFTGFGTGGINIGGVTGYNWLGIVQRSANKGAIETGLASKNVGGVVGASEVGTVKNCYSTGKITHWGGQTGFEANVGGVTGLNNNSIISNCYNSGSIWSYGVQTQFGGVVGWNRGTTQNCVSLGTEVLAPNPARRIVGRDDDTLSNNKARADQLIGLSKELATLEIGGNLRNGETVQIDNTVPQSEVFDQWDPDIWDIPTGNLEKYGPLPKLKNETDSPSLFPGEDMYTIVSSAGQGGRIDPAGNQQVLKGGSQSYTVYPDPGWLIDEVQVNGVSVWLEQGNVYWFRGVSANHTIHATFIRIEDTKHIITASAGTGGSISPSGNVSVLDGGSQSFTVTANPGYEIDDVQVDGVSMGQVSSYRFTGVSDDHTIHATFTRIEDTKHIITASAGAGGSISPSGNVSVLDGGSQSFTVTANPGYEIDDVQVDGVSMGQVSSYRFTGVSDDHTIHAIFTRIEDTKHIITASAGTGGSISPSGDVSVPDGGNQSFTVTANPGYEIDDVQVDGVSMGRVSSYRFTGVSGSHTIHVEFEADGGSHEHNYSSLWSHDATHHWHECSCGEISEKAGHIWNGWTVTKAATATEIGLQERKCTVCGFAETEEIPATGGSGAGPDDPSRPSEPSQPSNPANPEDGPQTGDNRPSIWVLTALAALSAIGIIILILKRSAGKQKQ